MIVKMDKYALFQIIYTYIQNTYDDMIVYYILYIMYWSVFLSHTT